jgi:hypothetical protein
MASRVVYSHDFMRQVDQGLLAPEQFDYWFLCEGDSWMDRSSLAQLSLPWALSEIWQGQRGNDALFINLSRFGHRIRHIEDALNDDFLMWLNVDLGFRFDALLFSAGGNDLIDAALKPAAGTGLLNDMRGAGPGLTAADCLNAVAASQLVTGEIDPAFGALYDLVRGSNFYAQLPIFLNSYNVPVARDAPALKKAWLFEAYRKNGIPPESGGAPFSLWRELTESIFHTLEAAVTGWPDVRVGVVPVPTAQVALVPADPLSRGDSGDWVNEIHPNKAGWRKLAPVWMNGIHALVA